MAIESLRPGDPCLVGPHRLLGRLGQGGMGTVYLGVTPDDRVVAVKVLRDGCVDAEGRRRFRRELEVLQRVRGPHLVEVLGGDASASTPWIVTRFVPGQRLDELVMESGPLPEPALLRLALGVALALRGLHAAGVVHRDLTPGNVLVLDGEPHVIDLGLAVVADLTAVTRSGLVLGTAGYLAPEQVLGEAWDSSVDVHAWGATLALAGTGRPPYGTGRPEALLYRVIHASPDLRGLPAVLAPLVAAALAKDAAERPSVNDIVLTLTALGSRELVAVSSGPQPRRTAELSGNQPSDVHIPDGPVPDARSTEVLGVGATRVLGQDSTLADGQHSTQAAGQHLTETHGRGSPEAQGQESTQVPGRHSTAVLGMDSTHVPGRDSTAVSGQDPPEVLTGTGSLGSVAPGVVRTTAVPAALAATTNSDTSTAAVDGSGRRAPSTAAHPVTATMALAPVSRAVDSGHHALPSRSETFSPPVHAAPPQVMSAVTASPTTELRRSDGSVANGLPRPVARPIQARPPTHHPSWPPYRPASPYEPAAPSRPASPYGPVPYGPASPYGPVPYGPGPSSALSVRPTRQAGDVGRRPGSLQRLVVGIPAILFLASASLLAPVVVAAATAVTLILVQTSSRATAHRRRLVERRGPRRRDPVVGLLGLPARTARAVLDLVLAGPLVVLAAAVPASVTLQTVAGGKGPAAAASVALVLGVVVAVTRRRFTAAREGLGRAAAAVAPRPGDAFVIGLVLLAAAALLLAVPGPIWWPVTSGAPSCVPRLPCS